MSLSNENDFLILPSRLCIWGVGPRRSQPALVLFTIFLDPPNLKKIPHPIPSTSTRLVLEWDGEFNKPNNGTD